MKGKYLALMLLLAVGAEAARAFASPSPTPPPKRGDRPAPSPAAAMAVAQPAVPTMNTPQHAPDQLDFGQVLDGKSATRTLSLTTNAPGYVTVNIPPGPFRVAEFREMAQTQNPSKISNGQFPAAGAVRSRIKYQEGQNGPFQWSMAPNTEMQIDVVFTPKARDGGGAFKTTTMSVSGPGPHGNWVLPVPLRGSLSPVSLTPEPPQPSSRPNLLIAQSGKLGNSPGLAGPSTSAQKFTVEELKLRLSALQGLKVKTSALTHNPTMLASQHAAGPGGGTSAALSGSPKTASAASRSGAALPGHGQVDPTATLSQSGINPCQSYGKDPVLISIDNQPNQWVFSNEPHTYRFTGCNFGSPQRFLRLHFTDPGSGWTDDLPLAPTSWQNQEILAQVTLEVSGGKVIPMPDINSLEVQLFHESIPGKFWVLGKGKFRAVRGNPVLLTTIPQALIAAFPQGSPYVLAPMTNFYGVNGAMGIVRPNLNSLIPLGQDKVNLALKSGFVIDSAQLQYLVYDNQGQGSTTTADSSHLSINGNNILINYPIDSITQNGQPFYYSIYGLKVWVVGPKDIDPWQ